MPDDSFSRLRIPDTDTSTPCLEGAASEVLAADGLGPRTASVTVIDVPHGESMNGESADEKPMRHHADMPVAA